MAFILEQGEEIQSCKIVVRCCWRQRNGSLLRVSRYSSVSCALLSKDRPAVSQALEAVWFHFIGSHSTKPSRQQDST